MSTTIRTYRNSVLVDTEVDPDDGDFAVTVGTAGWAPGTYSITATAQVDGYSESPPSNALSLVVQGFIDNFTRPNSTDLNANTGATAWLYYDPFNYGVNFRPQIINNTIAPPNDDFSAARLTGSLVDQYNHTVIARAGPGYAGGPSSSIAARFFDAINFVGMERKTDGLGALAWTTIAKAAGVLIGSAEYATTDPWAKIVCSGTSVSFYTAPDSSGAPGAWTQRGTTLTDASLTFSGQPGLYFWAGRGTTGVGGTTHYVDDFSALNT
jgi:hypothetical protein